MTQLFVFGSGTAYGIGSDHVGWADLLKQSLASHGDELYNFAQPGATIEFVRVVAPEQLKFYRRSGEVVAIVAVGEDSFGTPEPDNPISSMQEYEPLMAQLIEQLLTTADKVVIIGVTMTDGSKTGRGANDQRILYNHMLAKLCNSSGATFVDIGISPDEWAKQYLHEDGVYPNQRGHHYIFEKVSKTLEALS